MASVRVRLSREARRAELLELGVRMLATRRLDDLPTDEIAAAAGISAGLLFHYFPTKHDFHVAVAREAARRLVDRVRPVPGVALAAQLGTMLSAYVDHLSEHHGAYVSLIRGAAGGDPGLTGVYEETRAVFTSWLMALLASQRGGAATPAEVLAVRGWQSFVEEATLVWMEGSELDRAGLLALLEQSWYRLLAFEAPAQPPE